MPTALILDLLLRGGAIALAVLVMGQMLRARPVPFGIIVGVALMAVSMNYTIMTIPALASGFEAAGAKTAYLLLKYPGFIAANVFLAFARALEDDKYRPDWIDGALLAASTVLYWFICFDTRLGFTVPMRVAHVAFSLVMVGWAMRLTWLGLCDDLVETRRSVARAMLYIMPLTGAVILIFTLIETVSWPMRPAPLIQSAMLFGTSLAFAAAMTAAKEELFANPRPVALKAEGSIAPADRIELARLQDLMVKGVFLEPGLSIGGLADRMGVPEHRLRKLINNHLGYRNFAAFINDHRIDEAKRRLGNAALARDQITGLAFELGFASLAPFNRAFKERVGMSPSEFRTRTLTELLKSADSRVPS
ncbi:MAG: helix-turn-helix domain-containing protein [Rhizobiaceae bacterium]|jgi:AraC-like DNA-binding protein|nr:helix-turn-helix domain-containing protein [Rhizobiaceae bacterium]